MATNSSRYKESKVINMGNGVISLEIYKAKPTKPPDNTDVYMTIPPGMQYRPDLASWDLYKVHDFWWKIMEYNGMKDIMEFKAGVSIRIPLNIYF